MIPIPAIPIEAKSGMRNDPAQVQMILRESDLQSFADAYCRTAQIRVLRIPDRFWAWAHHLPVGVRVWLYGLFGQLPDLIVYHNLGNGHALATSIELKRPGGYLRPKQRAVADVEGWQVVRSPEEFVAAIAESAAMAEKIKASHIENRGF